jgi:hypothetical protein
MPMIWMRPLARARTTTSRSHRASSKAHYDPSALIDAPEHHEYARAMGLLTWSTWDHGLRPVEHRIKEFVSTFPPDNPVRYTLGGSLVAQPDRTYAPGSTDSRLNRFRANDWRPGSFHELLARYGLRVVNGPAVQLRPFEPGSFRETTRRRNIRLRVLHGGVDIEAENMDAAKAEYLDRQESKRAAQDIREAIKRMKDELSGSDEPPER